MHFSLDILESMPHTKTMMNHDIEIIADEAEGIFDLLHSEEYNTEAITELRLFKNEVDSLLWNLFGRETIEFDMAIIENCYCSGLHALATIDVLLQTEKIPAPFTPVEDWEIERKAYFEAKHYQAEAIRVVDEFEARQKRTIFCFECDNVQVADPLTRCESCQESVDELDRLDSQV